MRTKSETSKEFLAKKKEGDGKLSKLDERMLSDTKPLIDLSGLTES